MKRRPYLLTTASILAIGAIVALLPLLAESPGPREMVVVARQMSFYVGGDSVANGAIRVAPGEKIRIVLVNADPGLDHDFAVTAWGVKTPVLQGEGRTSIEFRAPDTPGTATYVCSVHASMMRGTIEVVAPRDGATPQR